MEKSYTSKEIRELYNLDTTELTKLRNSGKIQFEKVNSKRYNYFVNEELEKEFLKPAINSKNKSTSSFADNVEQVLSDESLEFPEYNNHYYGTKQQKKLNAYAQRDYFIRTYRKLSEKPEVTNSIDEILNEILTPFDSGDIVKLDLPDNDKEIGTNTKEAITESFEKCLDLLDWKSNAYFLTRDWYIDGFKTFECIYDNDKIKNGITNLVSLSPYYFRDLIDKETKKPFYTYDRSGVGLSYYNNISKIDIKDKYTEEQLIYVGSGLYDSDKLYEMSYLHSALKTINDLNHIENGIIKYRITRASEKNVWNIDVGTMPKQKAENHLNTLSRTISSNVIYNTETGETNLDSTEGITDDWLFPSRNGKQKTEVSTINGNSDFISKLEDLNYFRRKLYEAMKIPVGRLDGDSSLDYSSTDILREELKFTKFITRLRTQLNNLFLEFIRRDTIAKGEINDTEWVKIKKSLNFKWNISNQIVENAELENLRKRFELINELEESGVIGKWLPMNYVVNSVLKMTNEEFDEYRKQIEAEKKKGLHQEPEEEKDDA